MRLPEFYAITAATLCRDLDDFLGRLERALIGSSLRLVQVRDKNLAHDDRARLARECARLCRRHQAQFLVNDDEELALQVGADGIHLSSGNLTAAALQSNWPLIGASVHSLQQAQRACRNIDPSFLVLSPVNSTLTHINARPLGWDAFRKIASAIAPKPVYALGGLGLSDLKQATSCGAAGIAAMRSPWGLQSPPPVEKHA